MNESTSHADSSLSRPGPNHLISRSPRLRWFEWNTIAAVVGGIVLRLWMFRAFSQVNGDGLIYGGIAGNILQHGKFAITDRSGVIHPTLIRLPGYPLFLAGCFSVFGVANYSAVAYLQIVLEVIACLLLADFVRCIANRQAGQITLWLAATCPFTAVYSGAPLTESLTFDVTCLALWSIEHYLSGREEVRSQGMAGWGWLFLFTLAISCAALLRPDGALLALALWPALLFSRGTEPLRQTLSRAILCGLLSVLPFGLWAVRNWQAFHVFEPLAPRYANDPGEDPHVGWQHWIKTWCVDFTCTYEVYWNAPDGPLAMDDLPALAFDSPQQQEQTLELITDYNRDQDLTPEIDARFEALARQRIADHPIRTHILLPLGRLADMTLRPRVENLNIDLRWWEYRFHHVETRFSVAYGLLNLIFLVLGILGLCYRPRYWPYMVAYLILRSLLLLTIEAPETRYTLEFFPFLFVGGGIALQRLFSRKRAA